jgi:hypothetical protein
MMSIFHTFEEIKGGYCVYDKAGAYKGEDDYGTPIFGRRLSQTVSVAHGYYKKYIAVDIVLNRQMKQVGFRYGYENTRLSRQYEFSESGYAKMLADIKKDLQYDAEQIKKLLADLERSNENAE